MRDDYLWDRSGPPDPDVDKLERLLGEWRLTRKEPLRSRRLFRFAAAALVLVVAALSAVFALRRDEDGKPPATCAADGLNDVAVKDAGPGPGPEQVTKFPEPARDSVYEVTLATGSAVLLGVAKSSMPLQAGRGPIALPVGAEIRCDAGSRVELSARDIGSVTLEDETLVRLDVVRPDQHRLWMERGKMSARIRAPPDVKPRLFQVGTPAGLAVDMGCVYKLEVAPDGLTTVEVTVGAVAFETEDGQAWVTSRHRMLAPKGRHFGLPFADFTTDEFRAAVAAHDGAPSPEARRAALLEVLRLATTSDKLTLWNLLSRCPREERARVLDRFGELQSFTIDRAALLALDPEAMTALRHTFSIW